LIDEIDYDELIEALRTIVSVYGDEICPYAVELCQKLGEAYCRLAHASSVNVGGGNELEEDAESSLTAGGLMGAIRRILSVISGRFPTLYPAIEEALAAPLALTLKDEQTLSTEDGLHCLCELTHNAQTISPRIW
jgi:hypothetical protein